VLKLMKQNQLIEQHGPQYNQLGALQTFDRDLTSPLKDVLEQAIKGLNGLMTQPVDYLAYRCPGVSAWVRTTSRGDQQAIVVLTLPSLC
jgi:hypothetical protein